MAAHGNALYRARLRRNRAAMGLSMMAMAAGLAVLAWILSMLVINGVGALSWAALT